MGASPRYERPADDAITDAVRCYTGANSTIAVIVYWADAGAGVAEALKRVAALSSRRRRQK